MNSATGPDRSRLIERSPRRFTVCSMLVFGIVASVLPTLISSLLYTRIGMVVAGWMATFAIMAMLKYRHDCLAEGTRANEVKAVYEYALERDTSARREYELGIRTRLRRGVDTGELAAVRAELAAVRAKMELLVDAKYTAGAPMQQDMTPRPRDPHTTHRQEANLPWGTPLGDCPQQPSAPSPRSVFTGSAASSTTFGPSGSPLLGDTVAQQPTAATDKPRRGEGDQQPASGSSEVPPWYLHSWYSCRGPSDTVPQSRSDVGRASDSQVPLLEVTLPSLPPFDATFDTSIHAVGKPEESMPIEPVSMDAHPAAILDDGSHTTGLTVAQIMANLRSEARSTLDARPQHRP